METRAHYALIGAFTLAVIAAAFSFVFWFSGVDKGSARKTYRVVFTSSVSGLSRGSWVLFNGLRVGEVTKIDLADDPRIVNAMIDLDPRTPIKIDTKARLEQQGLTGVASVALTGGSLNALAVEKGDDGSPPTIFAERSEIQNILETLQGLSGRVDNLLDRADKVLADNSASIGNIVQNVDKFSAGLADSSGGIKEILANFAELGRGLKPFVDTLSKNSANIDSTLKDTRELAAKLSAAADKVEGFMTSAQNLFSGAGAGGMLSEIGEAAKSIRKLAEGFGGSGGRGTIDEINEAAKSFRKLAENLDVRTRDITSGLNRVTGPARRQYEALAGDARRALDEVNRAVRSLEKNPQQLIFGAKPQVPEYSPR